MNKHVRNYLDLSTGNIPFEDTERLDQAVVDQEEGYRDDAPTVRPYSYGWWVWVPEADDLEMYSLWYTEYGLSTAFLAVLRYARENGCDWINFDRDADPCPDLETFDW